MLFKIFIHLKIKCDIEEDMIVNMDRISTEHKKSGIHPHTSRIALYGAIQVLICFVALVVQYIFVSFTDYKKFTEMKAETTIGTLILRLSLLSSFAISGCVGMWASHKQSVMSIYSALVAASVAACFCLVYMVESMMCVMHMVRELEKKPLEETVVINPDDLDVEDDVLNINVFLGSESSFKETSLENTDLKLRLTLFTTQLIVCFIQAIVVILFCNKLNQTLKRNESLKYFRFVSK